MFVQILSSESSLTALDDLGDVWVYLGQKFGWAKLNMNKLSENEAYKVRKIKFGEKRDNTDEEEDGYYHSQEGR